MHRLYLKNKWPPQLWVEAAIVILFCGFLAQNVSIFVAESQKRCTFAL